VLGRAASFLKDNRIPPEGFVTDFVSYYTIAIVGEALNDYDFNKTGNTEGSGKDYVHYHIPLTGLTGLVSVYAKVFYQAVPPRWVKELFSYSSDDIDAFKSMYNAADRSPVLAAHDSMLNVALPTSVATISSQKLLRVMNSLSSNSVTIENNSLLTIYSVNVYGTGGIRISSSQINSDAYSIPFSLPKQNGIYFLEIKTNEGKYVFKVARQ
ncbi:MAG: T9SS type A sorting domain-containing protein, partial [Chitinophagales bacterium]|nr:T9SS type A sorting domain-containing protein [Chitinophagales bacterium]